MHMEYLEDGRIIVRDSNFVHIFTWEYWWDDGYSGAEYICVSPDGCSILHEVGTAYEWCANIEDREDDEAFIRWQQLNPVASFASGSLHHYAWSDGYSVANRGRGNAMAKPLKISKRIRRELEKVGGYRVTRGGRHFKIYVDNTLVGISPSSLTGDGQTSGYAENNVIATIRRVAGGRNLQVAAGKGCSNV